jgi:hypothetical protein
MNMPLTPYVSEDPLLLTHRAEGYVLKDVWEKWIDGCRDEVALDFGNSCLLMKASIDDDMTDAEFRKRAFRTKKGYVSVRSENPWKEFVGKTCGWTWSATNQQGYRDTTLISFEGIEPNVLLQTMASSIDVYAVKRCKTRTW